MSALAIRQHELIAAVLMDARTQRDTVRGQAILFGSRGIGPSDVRAEHAEQGWRRQNPGLAQLLDCFPERATITPTGTPEPLDDNDSQPG